MGLAGEKMLLAVFSSFGQVAVFGKETKEEQPSDQIF